MKLRRDVFRAHGAIHEFIQNKKIIRTFEMDKAPFGVQLEFLDFDSINETTTKLKIHTVFETIEQRNQLPKLLFAKGIKAAPN